MSVAEFLEVTVFRAGGTLMLMESATYLAGCGWKTFRSFLPPGHGALVSSGSSPASRPAISITLFLLIVAYLLMVVLVLRNNKSTRYAASFQLLKHQIQL